MAWSVRKNASSLNKIRCLLTFNNNRSNNTEAILNKSPPKSALQPFLFIQCNFFLPECFSLLFLGSFFFRFAHFTIQALAGFIYFHFLFVHPTAGTVRSYRLLSVAYTQTAGWKRFMHNKRGAECYVEGKG